MTNILTRLSSLTKVDSATTESRTEMTEAQIVACKAAIKRDNRGHNVQPNRFDISAPYRVAINYNNKWHNFGDFASADVAAAVGTVVSAAFFGEKAKQGVYDAAVVNSDPTLSEWLSDERNADVLARAEDPKLSYHATSTEPQKAEKMPF